MPASTSRYRRDAIERAALVREQLGAKKPWVREGIRTTAPHPQAGKRLPNLARAHQAEAYYRCKCAIAAQLGTANNQAQAMVACGGLVFGKKVLKHLADVHELRAATIEAALEYFDLVDAEQGAES